MSVTKATVHVHTDDGKERALGINRADFPDSKSFKRALEALISSFRREVITQLLGDGNYDHNICYNCEKPIVGGTFWIRNAFGFMIHKECPDA